MKFLSPFAALQQCSGLLKYHIILPVCRLVTVDISLLGHDGSYRAISASRDSNRCSAVSLTAPAAPPITDTHVCSMPKADDL